MIIAMFYSANAAWVMFSDGDDTYIYNNVNGDIYIKYKKGGKNYEDIFVKMPSGVVNLKDINKDSKDSEAEIKLKNKINELERKMLDDATNL